MDIAQGTFGGRGIEAVDPCCALSSLLIRIWNRAKQGDYS